MRVVVSRLQRWAYPVFWLGIAVVLGILPSLLADDTYWGHIINEMAIFVILAAGMNLAMGYGGQFNLAIGGLFGVGAYATALCMLRGGSFLLGLGLAAVLGTICGVLVGLPAIRVRSHYLALVTLGLGEVLNILFVNWSDLTGGPIGLPFIPFAAIGDITFATDMQLSYLLFTVMLIMLLLAAVFIRSRFGRNLKAIRDDEIAAAAMGINVGIYKLLSFGLSGLYAGVAGALYTAWEGYLSPDTFGLSQSIFILAIVLVGGVGMLIGPVIGSFVLVGLQQYLLAFGDLQLILYGLMIVVIVLLARGGIAGGVASAGRLLNDRLLARRSLITIPAGVPSSALAGSDEELTASIRVETERAVEQ